MKLNLTYVDRKERTSAKTNKPYVSISIKAKEYGDKFLSGFGNEANKNWKVGDEVEVEAVTSKESNGKTYLNFEMPKISKPTGAISSAQAEEILTKLGRLQFTADKIYAELVNGNKPVIDQGFEYPSEELNPSF